MNIPTHSNFESDDYRQFVKELYTEKGCWTFRYLAKELPLLHEHIDRHYSMHARRFDARKIYRFINEDTQIRLCRCCENEVTGFRAFKYAIHCSKKCAMSDPLTVEKIAQTNISKYGGRSAFSDPTVLAGYQKTMLDRHGVTNPFASAKVQENRREKLLTSGKWIDHEDGKFKHYEMLVRRETRKHSKNIDALPNRNLRGRVKGTYHLDHRFSVYEGFKQGIDPKIIGNIVNLEFIPCSTNCGKAEKCSITKDQLLELYKTSKI